MEDPRLNRIIEETRELHTRWGQFHEFFKMAVKAERISPEAEAKFLDLKTRIAMLHDGFMQGLKSDQKVGQGVLGIISSCIMLRRIPLMSTAEAQKLELDWNEIYLLMTETIANLEDERERISKINASSYKFQQFKMQMRAKAAAILQNGIFQLSLILFLIGFVIVGVPMFGIYDYNQIREDIPILAPVVEKVQNWARALGFETPYVSISDMAPRTITDIQAGDPRWKDIMEQPVAQEKASREFFVSQLYNYGFADTDVGKIKGLTDTAKEWRVEGAQNFAIGQGLVVYLILMPTSTDAQNIVSIRKAGLAKRSKSDQDNINSTISVSRVANLFILAVSESRDLREDLVKAKYNLTDKQLRP